MQLSLLADTSSRGFSKLQYDSPTAFAVLASLSTLMFFMRANYLSPERILDAGEAMWKKFNEMFKQMLSSFSFLLAVGVIAWGSSASWGSESDAFVHPRNGTEPSSYLAWVPEAMRPAYRSYWMFEAAVPNANFVFALLIAILTIQKDYGAEQVSFLKAFSEKVFPGTLTKLAVVSAVPEAPEVVVGAADRSEPPQIVAAAAVTVAPAPEPARSWWRSWLPASLFGGKNSNTQSQRLPGSNAVTPYGTGTSEAFLQPSVGRFGSLQ